MTCAVARSREPKADTGICKLREEPTDWQIAVKVPINAWFEVTTYSTMHLGNSVILARHDDSGITSDLRASLGKAPVQCADLCAHSTKLTDSEKNM